MFWGGRKEETEVDPGTPAGLPTFSQLVAAPSVSGEVRVVMGDMPMSTFGDGYLSRSELGGGWLRQLWLGQIGGALEEVRGVLGFLWEEVGESSDIWGVRG